LTLSDNLERPKLAFDFYFSPSVQLKRAIGGLIRSSSKPKALSVHVNPLTLY
jgi:hypothetical protein